MILSSEGVTSPGLDNWQRTQFECLNGNIYIVSYFCIRQLHEAYTIFICCNLSQLVNKQRQRHNMLIVRKKYCINTVSLSRVVSVRVGQP